MAEALQLRIVTPRRPVLDETVLEVTAPGTAGEFGVLPEHANFLTSLEIGILSYRDQRAVRRLAVRGGFAEVSDNVMTVLADAAERPEEVDRAKAEADLRAAAAKLATLAPIDAEYPAIDGERRWAEARLELARKAG